MGVTALLPPAVTCWFLPLLFCSVQALDAATGMMYLHRRSIIHRDVKTPNLLVDSQWHVKVSGGWWPGADACLPTLLLLCLRGLAALSPAAPGPPWPTVATSSPAPSLTPTCAAGRRFQP